MELHPLQLQRHDQALLDVGLDEAQGQDGQAQALGRRVHQSGAAGAFPGRGHGQTVGGQRRFGHGPGGAVAFPQQQGLLLQYLRRQAFGSRQRMIPAADQHQLVVQVGLHGQTAVVDRAFDEGEIQQPVQHRLFDQLRAVHGD